MIELERTSSSMLQRRLGKERVQRVKWMMLGYYKLGGLETKVEQSRLKEDEGEMQPDLKLVKLWYSVSGVLQLHSHRCRILLPPFSFPITQHYLPVTPCHYQALSPTAGGHRHSKLLLGPAVVNSFCCISRPGCCQYHSTLSVKATPRHQAHTYRDSDPCNSF